MLYKIYKFKCNLILFFCFTFRFALINAGVIFIYFTSFQKIDDEEYGGPWELTKEGFFTSFSLFLVNSRKLVDSRRCICGFNKHLGLTTLIKNEYLSQVMIIDNY